MKKDQYCDVLILFFCGTSGLNNSDLLGSDESDVVVIAWQLIYLDQNKTGDIHYIYVNSSSRPPSPTSSDAAGGDDAEIIDCSGAGDGVKCGGDGGTGISDELLQDAPSFGEAMQQFEHTVRYELSDQKRTCSFTLCTDGQCHIRQVLMPQSVRTDTALPEFCYSFFDLKKEFMKCMNGRSVTMATDSEQHDGQKRERYAANISVHDMLNMLNVQLDELGTFGVDHVRRMSSVVQVLLSDDYGHVFNIPERILQNFATKPPCGGGGALVTDDTIVRARGLPWQASDHDVARFFKGLNIASGGVALVLNNQGRRNGEALVRFDSEEERDLALLRHKHHMANRYIEVYRATGDDFLNVASGTSSEALDFLNKQGDGIVRIRGLPFTANASDITEFFGDEIPVAHGVDGVLFVKYPDGKFTGDAFVLFPNEQIAGNALSKHKHTLGKRYVEIFKSTAAEVQQVLSKHTESAFFPVMPAAATQLPYALMASPSPTTIPMSPTHVALSQPSPGAIRNCIRLRGMPYSASVDDILNFLGDLSMSILPNGIHIVLNQQGRPSGDAFIQLVSVERASQAGLDVSKGGCHKKHMGERYVEVFQCSGDEMNLVLMGGTLNRNGMVPPPGMVVAQERLPPAPIPAAPAPMPFAAAPQATHAFLLQTPQGAFIVQSAAPPQLQPAPPHAQPIEYIQHHPTLQLQPRTTFYPPIIGNPATAYMSYAHYLPTPPLSPISPATGMPASTITTTPNHAPGGRVVNGKQVHMQGLPFTATAGDILAFFKGHSLSSASIKMLYNDKLCPIGEAIVNFSTMDDAYRAVVDNNRRSIGNSSVELSLV